jgi:hypothetical protein
MRQPPSADQVNQIIAMLELEQMSGRRPSHKAVAHAVGCTFWQSRYYWRRHLRHKAWPQDVVLDLKGEIAAAIAERDSAAPYKPGPLEW